VEIYAIVDIYSLWPIKKKQTQSEIDMIRIKKNGIVIRDFQTILFSILISSFLSSCSTISKIDRAGKDYNIDNKSFERINGRYNNRNTQSNWTIYDMLYDRRLFHKKLKNDSVVVVIKAINAKKLELSFVKGNTCFRKQKLRGHYENGYFSVNAKFGFLSPLFPILWGPGTYNMSIGISKNDNLVILESHGGTAIFLVIPFFASGSEGDYEFKRLE
jgi:hypothetical protein